MLKFKRNENLNKLHSSYLFRKIAEYKQELLEKTPDAELISIGIGNTTEPLPELFANSLAENAKALGTVSGYSGYGSETGNSKTKELISEKIYNSTILADEILISDGAKCDVSRLQMLLGQNLKIAVQDPSYPAYVDNAVIMGQTDKYNTELSQYGDIVYLECSAENNFFPDLEQAKDADVIYFCSPNNPTGIASSKEELTKLVNFANKNGNLIIFDAAYSSFIRDKDIPKSIFEIDGSKTCCIEINSFSKSAGYTGVRLGWSAISKELKYNSGESVLDDWNRIVSTTFNGASNIVQNSISSLLSDQGETEIKKLNDFYLENAKILKTTLQDLGFTTYGGDNSPYIWCHFEGKKSWQVFEEILNNTHIVTTPGVGFGPSGESYLRLSAFGSRDNINKATRRLSEYFNK